MPLISFFKKRNAKRHAKKRIYRRKSVPKTSKAFVKKVKAIIHKQTETKLATWTQPFTSYNSGINATGDIGNVLPSIALGTGDNARIGDQIRAQKMEIRGHLIMNQYNNYSSARIGVRIMVVQPKNLNDYNTVFTNTNNWLSNLLKRGGVSVGFTGLVADLYSDINTDAVTKYVDKVVFMKSPYLPAGNTNTVQDLDHQTCKFFRATFNLRNKLLKYEANVSGGIQPTNFSPCLIIGYAHLDGSAADTVNTQVSAQWNTNLYYEDS